MKFEDLKLYLLAKPETTEEIPFGPQALVYKVAGKMFALVAWDETPMRISLKCDPERAPIPALKGVGKRSGSHRMTEHFQF